MGGVRRGGMGMGQGVLRGRGGGDGVTGGWGGRRRGDKGWGGDRRVASASGGERWWHRGVTGDGAAQRGDNRGQDNRGQGTGDRTAQ